jgi:hypothetical protein
MGAIREGSRALVAVGRRAAAGAWRALRPTRLAVVRSNRRVAVPDVPARHEHWSSRTGVDATLRSEIMSLLAEQNARIRAIEAKAMGLLQVVAVITAIWAVSVIADAWAPVYLLPGLAYALMGLWSVMDVLRPQPRFVLSVPSQLTTRAPAADVAVAYEGNVPVEIRHANLVTAALFDMLRGAAVILVVGLLILVLS